jgi:glycosyltransferase involved in cell wall biosynthesis
MENQFSVSIVIPAFNEESAIADVVKGVLGRLSSVEHEVIVVNDCSVDNTALWAEQAGARVLSHPVNKGYGAALKTGIRNAKHEWIIMFDADGQHDPDDVLRLIERVQQGLDMVVGARDKSSFQYASRMPGKWLIHKIASFLVGEQPEDINSGLRIFRREECMQFFPILPTKFSFTTTLTLSMLKDGYRVTHIPIQTRARQTGPSTVKLRDGFRTIMLIIRIATLFNPLKVFMPVSAFLFMLGLVYGAIWAYRETNIPDGATLLMLSGVIIFFFGILSDQLASLRRMK